MSGPYNAFVSYSHAGDGLLAPRLQAALQGFARPWHRRRALEVFRDETGLSVNPGLWSSISDALDSSEWFVLLASPESAQSPWVNREIEHWCRTRGSAHISTVVTDGGWVWDPDTGDFDWERSTAVPPALRGAFSEEPRHIDMRWARSEAQLDLRNGRFRDQVAEIAAPMHGLAKDEMTGADVRQHRRTRRLASSAVIVLLFLLVASVVGAVTALQQASAAQRSERSALAAKSEAEAAAERQRAADAAAAESERKGRAESDAARAVAELERAKAESSAKEARRRRTEADAAATEADRQRGNAEASAAEARASADEARARKAEAELSAVRAREAAAEAKVQSAIAEANAQRAEVQSAIAEENARVARAQAVTLTKQAEDLKAQNVEIDRRGLVALAQHERTLGNHDRAVLLLAEADRAGGSGTSTRRELAETVLGAEHLRYLPGTGAGGDLVAGPGRVATGGAAATGQAPLVWDLTQPDRAPVPLEETSSGSSVPPAGATALNPPPPGGGPPLPTADCDLLDQSDLPPVPEVFRKVELHGFDSSGRRLVGVARDQGAVHVWDTDSGESLLRVGAGPVAGGAPSVAFTPDRTHVLVQVQVTEADGTVSCRIDAVDLENAQVVRSWPGVLRSTLGFLAGYERAADAADIGPDGRHFVYFDTAQGAWSLADIRSDESVSLFASDASLWPRFQADGQRVVGLLAPTILAEWDTSTADLLSLRLLSDDEGPVAVRSIALDSRLDSVAAIGTDGRIRLLTRSGRQMWATQDAWCPAGGSIDLSPQGGQVVADCLPHLRPGAGPIPRQAVFVPTARPTDPERFVLDGVGPITDLVDGSGGSGSDDYPVLASAGRVLFLGFGITALTEVPRLGLDGPCAVTPDRSALVCGSKRLEFADLGRNVEPADLGGLANDATAMSPDGRTWFSVTPTGRVAHIDPDRSQLSSPQPVGPSVEGASISRDGRWVVSAGDEGALSLTEISTGQHRLVDLGEGRPEVTGQLHGANGPLVVNLGGGPGPGQGPPGIGAAVGPGPDELPGLPPAGVPGADGRSVLVNPVTGVVTDAGLRELAVTSATGNALATWGFGSSTVDVRVGSDPATNRPVEAPGLAFGIALSPESRHHVAISDDAAMLAYVSPGDPGQLAEIRVVRTRDGARLFTEELPSDDQISGSFGPRLAFSPDGSTLVLETERLVRRWATTGSWTGKQVATVSRACDDPFAVSLPRFSGDGTLLYADGRILDAASLSAFYATLGCGPAPASFGESGDVLVVLARSSEGIAVRQLRLDVASLVRSGCQLAGRNLTESEWTELRRESPRPRTCAEWP